MTYKGRHHTAHRVAYCEHNKIDLLEIEGLVVRHMCDNPPCVNPYHLEIGTVAENNRDAVKRDRHAFAERHSRCKLTTAQVENIRNEYVRGSRVSGGGALAQKYGVSEVHIRQIARLKLRLRG